MSLKAGLVVGCYWLLIFTTLVGAGGRKARCTKDGPKDTRPKKGRDVNLVDINGFVLWSVFFFLFFFTPLLYLDSCPVPVLDGGETHVITIRTKFNTTIVCI